MRQNVFLDWSGSFPTIGKTYGPLFWVFAVYNYAIAILTLVILANAYREKISFYRKQISFLFIALFLPAISNILQISGINPFHIDTTPPVLGLSALIITWGIFRYRLFDVVPIAHSIIIREMRTGMIVFDNEGRFLDVNPAARKMLNLTKEDLSGHLIDSELKRLPDLVRIFKEGKDAICEISLTGNEAFNYYEVSFTQVNNSEKESIGWLLQIYDITERKISDEIVKHAAFHDSLTGLPNRSYFQILFSSELAHAKMRGEVLTVAFLDLDDFKMINDSWGHIVGDRVLCEVAERLKEILRDSDIISRIGGDEYAIILPHVGNDETIGKIGANILDALRQSIDLQDVSIQINASIGFSVFPRDADNIEDLLKKADKAMYMVKDNSKNNYCVYSE
jgi:diguanylate cyclase (GGDEF)-like protein/PAS domain S-box-containing protein